MRKCRFHTYAHNTFVFVLLSYDNVFVRVFCLPVIISDLLLLLNDLLSFFYSLSLLTVARANLRKKQMILDVDKKKKKNQYVSRRSR
jgi:hypothetical protein